MDENFKLLSILIKTKNLVGEVLEMEIRNSIFTLKLIIFFLITCYVYSPEYYTQTRDPIKWPFSQNSIWNMPIGDSAVYVRANLEPAETAGLTIDEDIICLDSSAPMTEIYQNFAGWNASKSRCDAEGKLLYSIPFPDSLVYSMDTWDGRTPNAGLVSLMPDGVTIKQSQPFARCYAGMPGTSLYLFDDENIYGEGIYGAHGGSGLSALGGTIRIGELMPGSGPIRHVIKMNIYAAENILYDSLKKGFTWPALKADGYAAEVYGTKRTTPFVKEVLMGSLLALPPWIDLDSLVFETEPGRRLAKVFQDYGAYIVDDTYWDAWAIETEWGPNGKWSDEFKNAYGFSFETGGKQNAWSRDIEKIYSNLHVVVNNGPNSIGGGGNPSRPLAPPFKVTK